MVSDSLNFLVEFFNTGSAILREGDGGGREGGEGGDRGGREVGERGDWGGGG